MRTILINFLLAMAIASSGCSVYRVDVQQGNVIDPKKLAELKTGLKKNQVIFLIGSPLLTDPFHANRWDYIYAFTPHGKKTSSKVLTLYFEGDTLVRIDDSRYSMKEIDR